VHNGETEIEIKNKNKFYINIKLKKLKLEIEIKHNAQWTQVSIRYSYILKWFASKTYRFISLIFLTAAYQMPPG